MKISLPIRCTNRRCGMVTYVDPEQLFLPRYCIRCGKPLNHADLEAAR